MKKINQCLVGATLIASYNHLSAQEMGKLEDTIVTAQAPVTEKTVAGTAQVIKKEEIQISGAENLIGALSKVPGITLSAGGGDTQQFSIRGVAPEFGLILIDGQRIPNVDRNIPFSSARYDYVSVDDIEKIEVLKGPSSNLYGADAMSGVVNIITKQPTDEWTGKLTTRIEDVSDADGTNQTYNLSASGSLTDNISVRLGYEKKFIAPIQNNFDEFSFTTFSTVSTFGDVTFDSEVDRYWGRVSIDTSATGNLSLNYLRVDEVGETSNDLGSEGNFDQSLTQAFARYKDTFGDFNFETSINYSSNKTGETEDDVWNDVDYNFNALLNGPIGDNHYVSAGIIARREEVDRASRNFEDDFSSLNIHIQDRIKFGDKVAVTVGSSVDFHDRYGTEFSPKLGVNYSLNDDWGIKVSAGQSYSAPALREASSEYIIPAGPTRTYIGNDDLQPETLRSLEAGVIYDSGPLNFNLTGFVTEIDDLVSTVTRDNTDPNIPGTSVAEYTNIDSASIWGIESSVNYNFTDKSSVNLNYTYLNAEDSDGAELDRRPEHSLRAQFSHSTDAFGGIDFYASALYTSDQINSTFSGEELDSYVTVNLAVRKKVSENLAVQFGVDNIFDDSVFEESGEVFQKGRSAWVKATVEF